MKLRFVKFLTSRENEIEKKEEGGGALPSRAPPSPSQTAARAHAPLLPSLSIISLSPPPVPPACVLRRPASPPPRIGRAIFSSYPSSSCSALPPFFFIKLSKQQSVADVVPSQPVQLSCPTITCWCPARPQARALPVPRLSSTVFASPVSRCGPSTSSEAIGKQRSKMRFPVSFPSLMNK